MDTNILVRYLVEPGGDQKSRVDALVTRIASGEKECVLSESVVFETVHVLQKVYGVTPIEICDSFQAVLLNPEFKLMNKSAIVEALNYWAAQTPLSLADCYHLTLAKSLVLTEIYSFDRKMDRFPGVTRIEP